MLPRPPNRAGGDRSFPATRIGERQADGRVSPVDLDFLGRPLRDELASPGGERVRLPFQIARFPVQRAPEDFAFTAWQSVDPGLAGDPGTGRFVAHGRDVLLFGPPGVGAARLAIRLERRFARSRDSLLFVTVTELVAALDKGHTEGCHADRLAHCAKANPLFIDALAGHLHFRLVVRRHERSATPITTNRRVTPWSAVLGDGMIAAATLDRLLHDGPTLVLQDDSDRMRKKRKSGLWTSPTDDK